MACIIEVTGFHVETTISHTNPADTDLHVRVEDVEPISRQDKKVKKFQRPTNKVTSTAFSINRQYCWLWPPGHRIKLPYELSFQKQWPLRQA